MNPESAGAATSTQIPNISREKSVSFPICIIVPDSKKQVEPAI